ncbi:MAG TPA: polysaccharide biosynthesis/export family protein [Bryobacteraceae bacterium]|jgi:polysaccharide export outer membrane protein
MMTLRSGFLICCLSIVGGAVLLPAQSIPSDPSASSKDEGYILGPEDSIVIKVLDIEEIGNSPFPIDLRGNINVPMIGRVHAAGLTLDQLEAILTEKFKEYLREPVVTVTISEYRSQPVSVFGQVGTPGVHSMRGHKTLYEVISEAGGLKPEAGNSIVITRKKEWGPIPLPGAHPDQTGAFTVAELDIHSVMEAKNPADNIAVKPEDVISVPKADLIYVVGSVKKAGGFVLSERGHMSVLQALSLAEGLDRTAAAAKARIIRTSSATTAPAEIPVDVKHILDGKLPDLPLQANDILFIPDSAAKSVTLRTIEAIVQAGTGAAVYRPF